MGLIGDAHRETSILLINFQFLVLAMLAASFITAATFKGPLCSAVRVSASQTVTSESSSQHS